MKSNNTGVWVAVGIAAAVAVIYFGGLAGAGGTLQYYIQSVDFRSITSGQIVLMVQNPSGVNIRLNSMAGTVSANGATLGNISNFSGGVDIPANSQTAVAVQVNISLGSLLGQLYSVLTQPSGSNAISFVIAGNANINANTNVPFSITQTVNV